MSLAAALPGVARLSQTRDDEIMLARGSPDQAHFCKRTVFNLAKCRRPDTHGMLVERVGAEDPKQ